ncbi:MAG: DUF2378 family protein [Myxococcaceae bacterium]|jgi:uncharacterized protein (TIGR02265 family)|nr:DUF2378 family protein [Myxococcaceae bacterium]
MDEPLVFPDAIQTLVDIWADPSSARRAFAELNVQVDRLEPAYPVGVFRTLLERTARARFPELPTDDALFEVGRASVEPYSKTALGTAIAAMLRLIGPARALRRIARTLRSTNNYSNAEVTQMGATEFEVTLDLVVSPPYEQGIISAGLTLAGARDVSVQVVKHEETFQGERAVFRVRWA